MYECSEAGKLRADEILLRIPLDLGLTGGKGKAVEQDHEMDTNDDGLGDGRVKQILEICKEYGREGVRREVCRVRQVVNVNIATTSFRPVGCGAKFHRNGKVSSRHFLLYIRRRLARSWAGSGPDAHKEHSCRCNYSWMASISYVT